MAFNLPRWFAVLSLICIAATSALSAFLLSTFLSGSMLHRDALVSAQFIHSIVREDQAHSYFVAREGGFANPQLEAFFLELSRMPDVVRTNAWAADGTVVWSSDATIIGRRLGPNEELEAALAGELTVESGIVGEADKPEHVTLGLAADGTRFVEIYIPVTGTGGTEVIGIIEQYKLANTLFEAISEGQRQIWISALAGGAVLYVALFWIVRRASRLIRSQQQQLVEAGSLAAIGELASVVAHGIRSPLGAIRSSAELALDDSPPELESALNGIISEADRMSGWVSDLLLFVRSDPEEPGLIDFGQLVHDCLAPRESSLADRNITVSARATPGLPPVRASQAMLTQVINGLLDNAAYTMPDGGDLRVRVDVDVGARHVECRIRDTGSGIAASVADRLFQPFFTTKTDGMGLGLALSRRAIVRYGGTLDLVNAEDGGAIAIVALPVAH